MMNENMNQERDLDLFDIIEAIFKKWKAVLCITLAVALLAGALGFVLAWKSNNSYGTTIEFYLKTEKTNEYILSLMRSDKFAETILLDEYGLPAEFNETGEYGALLVSKKEIIAKKQLVEDITRKIELADYENEVTRVKALYDSANSEYNQIHDLLSVYKLAENVTDVDAHNSKIKELEVSLVEKDKARDEIKAELDKVNAAKYEAEKELRIAKIALKNLIEDTEKPLEALLNKFRSNPENVEALKSIKKYVTFEYVKEMATSDNKNTGVDIYSEALLKVKVNVPDDSEFAEEITEAIVKKLPDFIDEKVFFDLEFNSESKVKPECKFISTFSAAEKISEASPVKNAVIYAAVGGVATAVVICMIIAVVEVFKRKKSATQVEEK